MTQSEQAKPTEAAQAADAPDELEQAVTLIRREPAKRELYLAALSMAEQRGDVARFDLEAGMAALPQAETMFQSMGTLIDALVREGLLDEQLPEPEYDPDTEETSVDMARARYGLTDKGARVLERCSKREIDNELAVICAKAPRSRHVSAAGIYPSYFTDRLEQSGGLVWRSGWTTTQEGSAFLKVFQ